MQTLLRVGSANNVGGAAGSGGCTAPTVGTSNYSAERFGFLAIMLPATDAPVAMSVV